MSFGYARHFVACNRHDIKRFAPLFIGGKRYGLMRRDVVAAMPVGLFRAVEDGVELISGDSYAARSAALRRATEFLCARFNKPLRNEIYPVTDAWEAAPIAEIDRVAVPWFGVRAWGVHVNGWARKKDGIYLWVAKRADNRPAEPGKLDNMIGGGQPLGLSFEENLCKEAQEEAGIAPEMARGAKRARDINYRMEWQEGVRTDTLVIYDLELPEDFTPQNTDGEVAAFHLMPLEGVAALVRDTDEFKFNCNLVIIDFLMRRGFISALDPEYVAITKWLHPATSALSA